jgi:cytochrome P450
MGESSHTPPSLESKLTDNQPQGYIPFSGGPRICLGQQYALTVAAYVVVRMLQKFQKLESRDPGPWKEMMTLTCASLNGVKVALTPA